jgi:protein gp37
VALFHKFILFNEQSKGILKLSVLQQNPKKHACEDTSTAFFFKQWGGMRPRTGGRRLLGKEWNGLPQKVW